MQRILRLPLPRFSDHHAKNPAFLIAVSAPKTQQQHQSRLLSLSFRRDNSFATNMSSGGAATAAETDAQATEVANASSITPASLRLTLMEKLETLYVDVEDISGE